MDSVTTRYAYGAGMSLLGGISCIGYGLIALLLSGRPELTKKNRFLISLGYSDAMIAVHAFVSTAAVIYGSWPFGMLGCYADAVIGMGCTFVSISTVAWIAKDKYYRVCKPNKAGQGYNFYLKLVWLTGMIAGLLPLIGFGEYGFESDDPEYQTGCLLKFNTTITNKYRIYIIGVAIAWFMVPIFNIISHYGQVSKKTDETCPMTFIVPLQMILSLTPYALYGFMSITVGVVDYPPSLVAVNNLAAKVFIATNPFLYIWADPDLSKLFKSVVCGLDQPEGEKEDESLKKAD